MIIVIRPHRTIGGPMACVNTNQSMKSCVEWYFIQDQMWTWVRGRQSFCSQHHLFTAMTIKDHIWTWGWGVRGRLSFRHKHFSLLRYSSEVRPKPEGGDQSFYQERPWTPIRLLAKTSLSVYCESHQGLWNATARFLQQIFITRVLRKPVREALAWSNLISLQVFIVRVLRASAFGGSSPLPRGNCPLPRGNGQFPIAKGLIANG